MEIYSCGLRRLVVNEGTDDRDGERELRSQDGVDLGEDCPHSSNLRPGSSAKMCANRQCSKATCVQPNNFDGSVLGCMSPPINASFNPKTMASSVCAQLFARNCIVSDLVIVAFPQMYIGPT